MGGEGDCWGNCRSVTAAGGEVLCGGLACECPVILPGLCSVHDLGDFFY